VEDPIGARCPFGAHVRRANPRDTRFPGSDEEIATVNRHRLLRVGRKYENRDHKGLFFMCLNGDIERQFEFVQATWLLNPNFNGLAGETDPIIGRCPAGKTRSMTITTPLGTAQLGGMENFVQMMAGGYFFMPGRTVLGYLASKQPAPEAQPAM
jgi:deferrochelatase/peroxidase EfeB